MHRNNVIILITNNNNPIVRGNFKKLCLEFDFPYHTLKNKKFPIEYKECLIYKEEFK